MPLEPNFDIQRTVLFNIIVLLVIKQHIFEDKFKQIIRLDDSFYWEWYSVAQTKLTFAYK
jgi:hypothetical protein